MPSQIDRRIRPRHFHSAFIYRQLDVLETKSFAVSSQYHHYHSPFVHIHIQESPSQAEFQWSPCLGHHSNIDHDEYPNPFSFQSNMLPATTNLVKNPICFNPPIQGPGISPVQQAPRRYWTLSTLALMYIVIVVTILSILVGVLVGVFAHNASLGIAATSGFAAILSSIAGILVLRFRRRQ